MDKSKIRVIISGGGTGGHIFPAVSIAKKIKELSPESEILFVGALGKMEMEKVPAEGFEIVGLPITGLQRQLNLKNLANAAGLPWRILSSVHRARRIIRGFKPDIAVGVGGYASAPLLFAATLEKIPTLIQEQNGFAGLTNKILGGRVGRICVAYEGMEKFFPKEKIVLTGNPIRPCFHPYGEKERLEGAEFYGMNPASRHILVVGGSLGSRTLNDAMKKWIEGGCPGAEGVEVLWQCGKYYKAEIDAFLKGRDCPGVRHSDFIARMDLAYALADVVISRSGASSISEICACGKASVLVPSPNVAEDHQTHNAMALVSRDAALMVRDDEASDKLLDAALTLASDSGAVGRIGANALGMAKPDAAAAIVGEIYGLL